ncbi:HupE/UreJ family protein [Fodinicurvata fenggangensis]|uniref:HupE/UreJ family protein n=1 Tax=Fodinicurvata fenggangensis TaxID=1121830 RepID=UPI00068D28B3|nr:HupE/UreJ family protein [Fodinicurvata fenggangensis]
MIHTAILRLARFAAAFLPAAFLASAAAAHPGHEVQAGASFLGGLAHPVTGMDHLLAMVAVGIWAYTLGGRALWAVPSMFVLAMAVAGAAGLAGWQFAMAESGIALSVLVLGVLIAAAVRVRWEIGAAMVGLFAVFHGFAHGAEIPAGGSPVAYIAGFLLATAFLHAAGVILGVVAGRLAYTPAMRVAGGTMAVAGTWMLVGGQI